MRHFCTYFDRNYLLHGLTMYRSLRERAAPFRLYVLCLDPETHAFLTRLNRDDLCPIALEEFERGDDALAAAKRNRSRVEYYFTCTPSLVLYVLNRFGAADGIDRLAYVDSDLFFFSSPEPLHDEMGDRSILIIGHRFSEADRERGERFGIYNVGYLVFRNDDVGRACLQGWREQCIEWCYDIVEEDRFADQKYLNRWPERFPSLVVSEHKGANLARWNCMNYELAIRDGSVSVDGQPLIFYHFNAFRIVNRWIYDVNFVEYRIKEGLPPAVLRFLYGTYIREVRRTWNRVRAEAPEFRFGLDSARSASSGWASVVSRMLRRQLVYSVGRALFY